MPFTFLDVVLVLTFVGICILSLTQGLLRQIMTLVILYFTNAVIGTFYPTAGYYLQAILPKAPTLRQSMAFLILMGFMVFMLELFMRRWFPNTRFPKLGVFDTILAIIPGVLTAAIVVGLLLSSLGHATVEPWGDQPIPARNALHRTVNGSETTPYVSQFMKYYMLTHRAWFRPPPPLLGHLLPDES